MEFLLWESRGGNRPIDTLEIEDIILGDILLIYHNHRPHTRILQ
jgi:hypothetical protein